MRNKTKILLLLSAITLFFVLSPAEKTNANRGDPPPTTWEPYIAPNITPSPADNSILVTLNGSKPGAVMEQCPLYPAAVLSRYFSWGGGTSASITSGPFAGQSIPITFKTRDGNVGACPTSVFDAGFYSFGNEQEWNGSASFDTTPLPNGTYGMNILSPAGETGLQVSRDMSFVVSHSTSTTIAVSSNLPGACWTISGPSSPPSGCGASGGPYSVSPGSYTISASAIDGYTLSVTPSNPMSVASGEHKTFVLTYTSTGGGGSGGPGSPVCSPSTQTILENNNANFTASGGTGSYTWSAPGGSPTTGVGPSFNSFYATPGTYVVTVTSGGLNGTCTVNVNAVTGAPGSIRVTSNIGTSWSISGPDSINCPGGCTDVTYFGEPTGTYTITTGTVSGYNPPTVTPGTVQTLSGSSSITFAINYSPYSPPACTQDALLSWGIPLPSVVTAGKSYTFSISAANTGDTYYYNGSDGEFGSAFGPSASVELPAFGYVVPNDVRSAAMGVALPLSAGPPFTLTFNVPVVPAGTTYTFSWQMYQYNIHPFDSYAELPDLTPCGPPLAPFTSRQFGNELTQVVTVTDDGTLQVNCSTPGATWTIAPGGMTGSAPSGTYTVSPGTYTVTYGSISGYDDSPPSTVVVTPGGSPPPAVCNYTLQSLNPPTSVSIDNSVCTKIKITWTDDSTNESGFRVLRATTSGGPYTQISNDLAPSGGRGTVYHYTDPDNNKGGIAAPIVGATYYYVVQAFRTTPSVVSSSSQVSAAVQPCLANLGNSVKNLISYQKNGSGPFIAYDKSSSVVGDGDVLRFTITVVNSGSASATINYINDITTVNLGAPTNCQIDKGLGPSACSFTSLGSNQYHWVPAGSTSKCTSNGDPFCKNWVLQFDTLLTAQTTDLNEFFKNTGDINYTDAGGVHDKIVIYGPVLFRKTGSKVPTFKEVSP